MNFWRKNLGQTGEDLAVSFLCGKGYKIIERNWRAGRLGEIDIVCERGGKIIFVEVKTRSGRTFGTPEEAITAGKKQKLAAMAQAYLQQKKLRNRNFSVDGVFIEGRGGDYEIRHLENILV